LFVIGAGVVSLTAVMSEGEIEFLRIGSSASRHQQNQDPMHSCRASGLRAIRPWMSRAQIVQ
jgi:hypothetical protein